MEKDVQTLCRWIEEAKRAVFFGGAGVSTESGVPDFRSKDGLYNQHDVRFDAYRPEYLLSHECLENEPTVFFEFYRQKMDTRTVGPNAAHRFLAELERRGKLTAVVTQNIDGLHERAGSVAVYAIHGSTARNYCARCGRIYPPDFIFDSHEPVPRCTCGGTVRCDVTLYGEGLPKAAVDGAVRALAEADLLIIGGTSLTVYPAASFIGYYRGTRRVIIDKAPPTLLSGDYDDLVITRPIGQVFAEIGKTLFGTEI